MTHTHTGARAHGSDPLLAFAEVTLGELSIGIDTCFVVRALPRPSRLARLPRSHGAIDGVFSDGGGAVPVVDLRAWMGDDATATPAQVLVLGAHGRRIALAVDAVRGLVRARASQVERIHRHDDEDGFFHSVVAAGPDRLLSLLDPARLLERVQAWAGAARDDGAGAAVQADAAAASACMAAGVSQALVRVGAETLALPAALVAQVLPHPPAHSLFAGAGALRGLIGWRGHHVPLLDPAGAFGIADAGAAAPLAMVLAQSEAMVAIPVDAVLAVRTLPQERMTAACAAGIDNPLVQGVALLDDGSRVLAIDGTALLAAHATPALSARTLASAGTAAASGARAREAGAHVVVDTGRRWAIPMRLLEEIMPLPADLRPLAGRDPGGDAPVATCAWRAQTLPVLDLREPGARSSAATAPQRLLVVRHAGRHAGLWVDDVVEMLPALAGETTRFRAAGKAVCMLTVGQGDGRTSYPVLDLASLPFLN